MFRERRKRDVRRTVLLALTGLVIVGLAAAAWVIFDAADVPNFLESGHPLDSTEVVDWEVIDPTTLQVTLRFRDDAPWWGCSVEALSDDPSLDVDERSIGVLRAKPMKRQARVMTMHLDNGTANDVDKVEVTDCDV